MPTSLYKFPSKTHDARTRAHTSCIVRFDLGGLHDDLALLRGRPRPRGVSTVVFWFPLMSRSAM
jgi:hypothetical protein